MEIKGIHEAYQLHAATPRHRAPQKSEEVPAGRNTAGSVDTVAISPQAAFQSKLDAAVGKYIAAEQSSHAPASSERIAALKLKYRGDACPVSGFDVAGAMLHRICGYPTSEDQE